MNMLQLRAVKWRGRRGGFLPASNYVAGKQLCCQRSGGRRVVPVAQGERFDGRLVRVADIDGVLRVGPKLEADGLVGVQAHLHVAHIRVDGRCAANVLCQRRRTGHRHCQPYEECSHGGGSWG